MESALSLILWTSMVMRWLLDEEAVKTLFEKLSFTVDIRCDLISYQMLGEAYEIAAQDHKAFDDLSSWSCLTRVMVLPFLEWMWRISIQACCQHINFQVSSSHAQAQGVEKKVIYTCLAGNTSMQLFWIAIIRTKTIRTKKTFYTKEYSCTVNKLLLMFSITFNNN